MALLDEIDRQLLALLQADDRVPVVELGKAIGVAPSTLNDRIRRLVKQGVITGFHAKASPEKLGLDLLAFVFVGWSDPQTEKEFLARVALSPEVMECHHVTGAWNYLMKVRLKTTRDLETFFSGVVKDVPGLQRTETLIVLSSPKDTQTLVAPGGLSLPMQPRLVYLLAGIVVAGLGLLVREPWLGLPWVVTKYLGSALWTGMVYCGFRVLWPGWRVWRSAIVAALFAAAIEFSQLLSFPPLDAFRATTLGALLMGRTFDWPDIAAYWVGIAIAAAIDWAVQARFSRR